MTNVIQMRREVLPYNVFKMIEDYMHGDLITLHIVGVTNSGQVINTSAGDVPAVMSKHDSLKKRR